MKLIKSSSVFFSSLKTNSYITPVTTYFQYSLDKFRYADRKNPFKVGEIEYKDGNDWKQKHEEDSRKHTRTYWYIVGGSSLAGALWSYFDGLKHNKEPIDNMFEFVMGGFAGGIVGLVHPGLIPVTVPLAAVLFPLYKVSEYNRDKYDQKRKLEYEVKKTKRTEETRDVLHEYTKYVEAELKKQYHTDKRPDILTYFNWCMQNNHYNHRYGYFDGRSD